MTTQTRIHEHRYGKTNEVSNLPGQPTELKRETLAGQLELRASRSNPRTHSV